MSESETATDDEVYAGLPYSETLDRKLTLAAPGLWAMLFIHAGAALVVLPQAYPTLPLIGLAVFTFVARAFCVSAGYHRYFSHRSFKTSRFVQFVLAFVGGMGVMRGALWWAAHHRQHHARSDKEGDPHSPIHGMLWSHFFWFMARGNQPTRSELISDYTKFPELVWLDRHEWFPIGVLVLACLGVGALYGHLTGGDPLAWAFAAWVWGANISSVALCHCTFSINSISHWLGYRRYDLDDRSTNNPLVALVSFGEGWHNNHHRWPSRAKLGEPWWELDISWIGIRLLELFRVVWAVRR